MTDHEPKNKAMPSPDSNQSRGGLRCTRECEIPGIGAFKVGDTVEDHEAYLKLKDHPFFTNDKSEVK